MDTYLCKFVRVRDWDVSVKPIVCNSMELTGHDRTDRDVPEDIVDGTVVVIVDQADNLIEDLVGDFIEG